MLKIHKNGLNCGTPLGWNQNKPELQTENVKNVLDWLMTQKQKNFMK